jgi:hypothetical protein
MLPTSGIVQNLNHIPPMIKVIILELRNLIASVAPDAAEVRRIESCEKALWY